MAVKDSGYRKKRKKRKRRPFKKLLIGEQVEVLYSDEGLRGSWHSGVVIDYGECARMIEYTNLLSEDNKSKLKESIQVSLSIEGLPEKVTSKYHRNNIRPSPPYHNIQDQEVKYGICVDAFLDDAWWEGVVFDRAESSNERLIFFPDQGDQLMVSLDKLRLTQEWNELSGHWKPRGTWLLLQVLQPFEQKEGLPVSIREIWFDLRTTDAFLDKIGVWTFGLRSDWLVLVSELIQELWSIVFGVITTLKELPSADTINNISKIGATENTGPNIVSNYSLCSSLLTFDCHNASDFVKSANCDSTVKVNEKCELIESPETTIKVEEKSNMKSGESWKNLDLEAAFYPDAVKICGSNQLSKWTQTENNIHNVRLKAKKHLLFLGWKIVARHTKTIIRVRYLSPEGKAYYSLSTACSALLNGCIKKQGCKNENDNDAKPRSLSKILYSHNYVTCNNDPNSQSLSKILDSCNDAVPVSTIVDSRIFEDSDNVFPVSDGLEPEKFPESILVYKIYADLSREKGKNEFSYDLNLMRLKVRKHLKYMGWRFWIKGQHRKELFITSPSGKRFKSLYLACDEYLREESRNNNKQDILSNFSNYTEISKDRKLNRRKVTSGRGVSRTLLSLLIENSMVQPMQKVYFIRKKDGSILKTGQIARDGIKCMCCKRVFGLSNFEVHAGSTYRRAAASIFLEDGRSLLQCQREMVNRRKPKIFIRTRKKSDYSKYQNDNICSVCHDVGELMLCDHCPSSFHLGCVGLKNVPEGNWYCPSCQCGICSSSEFNSNMEQFTEDTMLYCDQCEREYHVGCMREKGDTGLRSCLDRNWFCSNKCSKIFFHLRQLLGVSKPTSLKGFSCTILRSSRENGVDDLQFDTETMIEHESKLCVALNVLHECFVNIIEPRTQSDFVTDLLFNRESELRRLNLYGFYTMLLERGDELVSVATFRVHGEKVAEMPFIGTCVKYRRQGMCRLLMNELEKLLLELGVKNLLLPAVPQLLKTWASFGFKTMSNSDHMNFFEHTIVNFQDTQMCWKILTRAPEVQLKPKGNCKELITIFDSRIERAGSEINSKVTEEVDTMPCVGNHHLDQSGQSQTQTEKSPSRACINSTEQNVGQDKYIGSNVEADVSPIIALSTPTNQNMKSSRNSHQLPIIALKAPSNLNKKLSRDSNEPNSLVVHGGMVKTFKHFYKRRKIMTNKLPVSSCS